MFIVFSRNASANIRFSPITGQSMDYSRFSGFRGRGGGRAGFAGAGLSSRIPDGGRTPMGVAQGGRTPAWEMAAGGRSKFNQLKSKFVIADERSTCAWNLICPDACVAAKWYVWRTNSGIRRWRRRWRHREPLCRRLSNSLWWSGRSMFPLCTPLRLRETMLT